MITQIKLKSLWLARAWPFLWAHKPLCPRFTRDVLKIGRLHLCRSCTLAWSGIAASIVSTWLFKSYITEYGLPFALTLIAPLLLFSFPSIYKSLPRIIRDILRFGMGLAIPLTIYISLYINLPAGSILLLILVAFWWYYLHLRKRRKLTECNGCPELSEPRVCTGFTLQAEGVRQYEEDATKILMNSGYKPGKQK